jgi:hypothetical protein
VRVGIEASGYSRWFERLLAELAIEVWIGDAATALAPASAGTDADADQESAAGPSDKRRLATKENCVANKGERSWRDFC